VFGPAAALRGGFADPGIDIAFPFKPGQCRVNRPERCCPPGAILDFAPNRNRVRFALQPGKSQKDDLLELAKVIALRVSHTNANIRQACRRLRAIFDEQYELRIELVVVPGKREAVSAKT
jgi:hypothetical protein